MNPSTLQLIIPCISALIAASVALFISWLSRKNEFKKLVEDGLRKRKIELYDEFAKFLGESLYNTIYASRDEKEFEKAMFIFNHRAMIWMSDDVLKSYIAYRDTTHQDGLQSSEHVRKVLTAYFTFIKKMRDDCGHASIGIDVASMLRLTTREKVDANVANEPRIR